MLANLACVSSLTQLSSLLLHGVALAVEGEQLVAALSPLTGLTRLNLRFAREKHNGPEDFETFPWEDAVCGLTQLQELRVTTDSGDNERCDGLFKGALPAALSRLSALRRFEVLGMDDTDAGGDGLQLSELPALESAALRLHTLSRGYPGLGARQLVILSRLVSLSLALRVDFLGTDSHVDTCLPKIPAPALTELQLDSIALAPDSEQLIWLPRLPNLRRLVLKRLGTASDQLPRGVTGCSGLTELVMERMLVSFGSQHEYLHHGLKSRLRDLPAGPYLSRLVRLNLSGNALEAVPSSLTAATALVQLGMANQQRRGTDAGQRAAPVQSLHVLEKLPRLRHIDLQGFKDSGPGIGRFRAARPDVSITF